MSTAPPPRDFPLTRAGAGQLSGYRSRGWSGSPDSTRPATACRQSVHNASPVPQSVMPGRKRTIPPLDNVRGFVPRRLLGRPLSHLVRLRHRPALGRLASCMRWDKHIYSGAVWRSAGGGSSGLSHGLPHRLAAPYSSSDAVCCTRAGRCRRGWRDARLAIGRSGIALCHAHVPLPASYCVLALDRDPDRNLRLDRLPVGSRSLVLQA